MAAIFQVASIFDLGLGVSKPLSYIKHWADIKNICRMHSTQFSAIFPLDWLETFLFGSSQSTMTVVPAWRSGPARPVIYSDSGMACLYK